MVGEDSEALKQVTQPQSQQKIRAPLAVVVRVVASGRVTTSSRFAGGRLVVGAAPDCGLIVNDKAVSRHHLELTLAAEGVAVKDLASRNGTFFMGHKVGEITLALGSRLTLGQVELHIDADVDDFEGTQGPSRTSYGALVGQSSTMQRLFTLLERLEGSLATVMIQGESGTGKELVARALHDRGQVAAGPFIAINCGALDRSLVRSELFGHKKGSFTGAVTDSVGAFEAAHGGTLFLDEIGELPQEIQPLLLRALETGEVTRVGETRTRRCKTRLVTATNRELEDDVADGLFREDLYYRLKVVCLALPPLRARRDDIPLLAAHLTKALGRDALPTDILERLRHRDFRGNVRELKHALEAYFAVGELPEVSKRLASSDTDLDQFVDPTRPYAEQKEALVDRMTYLYLKQLIENTGGNRSEASRIAGLQRGYLRRLLDKHGLS